MKEFTSSIDHDKIIQFLRNNRSHRQRQIGNGVKKVREIEIFTMLIIFVYSKPLKYFLKRMGALLCAFLKTEIS